MKFDTIFNCGDSAWIFDGGHPRQVTIRHVRVEYTDSPGLDQGYDIEFDNYKPQRGYRERYMCVETGIGAGLVFDVGENQNIFLSESDCLLANAKHIAEQEAKAAHRKEIEIANLLSKEASLREQLAEIERIKAPPRA